MKSSRTPQEPSAALALEATFALGSTFGALMLSTLYGLTAHQTFRYFRMYRGDIAFFKILVFAIFAADTFHSATLMHMCYYYFVINYFKPLAFNVNIWSIQVSISATL
uniref:HIT-type domain-containing protein n=1 Tax=Ganoderma boninense TaxID=34458 RepID=A0A5K1JUY0_9APHY|nr:HIT-type domain-containing protein [Ganoderma boninense]